MQLYTYDPAPNARRLQLFLDRKGIVLDTRQIDLGQLEQMGDEFGAINPLRTVPTLQLDDGGVLTEVVAQCAYLELLHPEPPLMGRSAEEKAWVLNWIHRLFNTGFTPIAEAFRNRSKAFADRALPGSLSLPQIPALVERGGLRLAAFWPPLDEHLQHSAWLVGDYFSLADIDLYCIVEFAGWIKQHIPADCAALRAWHERATAALNS